MQGGVVKFFSVKVVVNVFINHFLQNFGEGGENCNWSIIFFSCEEEQFLCISRNSGISAA